MSVARGVLAVGRLLANLGYTAVSLKLERDAALRAFRHSLRQAGVPDQSIEELECLYPEFSINELTHGWTSKTNEQLTEFKAAQ